MRKYLNSSITINKENNIFNKNINDKYKLIPFNITKNSVGDTKYFPSAF